MFKNYIRVFLIIHDVFCVKINLNLSVKLLFNTNLNLKIMFLLVIKINFYDNLYHFYLNN